MNVNLQFNVLWGQLVVEEGYRDGSVDAGRYNTYNTIHMYVDVRSYNTKYQIDAINSGRYSSWYMFKVRCFITHSTK